MANVKTGKRALYALMKKDRDDKSQDAHARKALGNPGQMKRLKRKAQTQRRDKKNGSKAHTTRTLGFKVMDSSKDSLGRAR